LSKLFNFDALINKAEAYMEAKVKLVTMNIKEEVANIVTKLFPLIILFGVLFIFLIFLSLTLSLILNHYLESNWQGFAIITGAYFLCFLVLLWVKDTAWFNNFFKKKIINTIKPPND